MYWIPRLIIQGRLVLDWVFPSAKADMYLIPGSLFPKITCPISQGRLAMDSLSDYSRRTCIEFLVSILKADLYWIPCLIIQGRLVLLPLSHHSRQTCIGFLVSSFKADLYHWVPCLIIQNRLVLVDSLSHYSRPTCIGGFLFSLFKADLY